MANAMKSKKQSVRYYITHENSLAIIFYKVGKYTEYQEHCGVVECMVVYLCEAIRIESVPQRSVNNIVLCLCSTGCGHRQHTNVLLEKNCVKVFVAI